jgi:hypothetical protein
MQIECARRLSLSMRKHKTEMMFNGKKKSENAKLTSKGIRAYDSAALESVGWSSERASESQSKRERRKRNKNSIRRMKHCFIKFKMFITSLQQFHNQFSITCCFFIHYFGIQAFNKIIPYGFACVIGCRRRLLNK